MRILISSPTFLPRVGGLENQTALLAAGLAALDQDVVVVTRTPAGDTDTAEVRYRIVREPSPRSLVGLVRWAHVFLQQHISLKELWPLLLLRRPWVVSHHGWYTQENGRRSLPDRLKRHILRFADASVAVSHRLARDLETPSVVIPNAYRTDLFRELPGIRRDRELLFVGRLVSNKGVDLLLTALALLRERGLSPVLTIAGEGPERRVLEEQAGELGLEDRVEFVGVICGDALAKIMNQHLVLVIPSRYQEPFGIVALEGIGCGCVVVGSEGGGLAEAIGPCGLTFPNGDAAALASRLEGLLASPERSTPFRSAAAEHLSRHQPQQMAREYLAVAERALRRPSGAIL